MTREEREKALEVWYDIRFDNEKFEEARKISIKALEQEPKLTGICNECLKKNGCEMYSQLIKSGEKYTVEGCEKYIAKPCKDAISREEVLEQAWTLEYPDSSSEEVVSVKDIKQLPPVTPSRHKGHWIDQYNDGNWHCSKCGAIVEKDEQINHNWYFCYHCGAEMENQE